MTAIVVMQAPCCACGRVFSFHPNRVPSYDGRPVCQQCMSIVNGQRIAKGRKPFPIMPGAYEGAPEDEINWHGKPVTVRPVGE